VLIFNEAMVSAFAPGRLELIGNHTDYNEGYVLAFAINLGITAEGDGRDDGTIKLHNTEFGEDSFQVNNIDKNVRTPWANYFKGVLFQLQQAGMSFGGFEATITGTLPSGVGMSSSAAVAVATALFVQKLFNLNLGDLTDPVVRMNLAVLCRAAENDFVGVKCGILDQATSLLGRKDHAVFLNCRLGTAELVPLHPDFCFVVCHTGVKHMLLSSKYNQRRSECAEAVRILQMNKIPAQSLRDVTFTDIQQNAGLFQPRVFQRAMHVTTENERVLAAASALLQSDMLTLGRLMYESHASSREAFENSTPFLDQLVEIAGTLPGCVGARLTGGGFGGATINLVYRTHAESFMTELMRLYREKSGKEPQAWIVEASDGAA